jgi:hypothetical protein
MSGSASRWGEAYLRVPLGEVPRQFGGSGDSPYLLEHAGQVGLLCSHDQEHALVNNEVAAIGWPGM